MRVFLALELDGTCRNALAALQAELRLLELDATYPGPEQLHVTLCFFGELTDSDVSEKVRKLESFSYPAFDADVSGVSFFPSPAFVRVVWAGFGKGKTDAVDLQKKISSWLKYSEKQPFEPHVTLARVKTPKNREKLASFARSLADFSVPFRASRLTLYQSRLSSQGPQYVQLHSRDLTPSD